MFPKDRGTQNPPKWMVYNGSNPIKMDDLGGFPIIFGSTPISEVLGFSEFESIINFIGRRLSTLWMKYSMPSLFIIGLLGGGVQGEGVP